MKNLETSGLRYLSIEEWDKLKSAASTERDKLVLNLLYNLGCTVNELVNIRVSDIDFVHNRIRIKGESSRNRETRDVFMSRNLLLLIRESVGKGQKHDYKPESKQGSKQGSKQVLQHESESGSKQGPKPGLKQEYLLSSRQSQKLTTKRVRQLVQSYCALVGIKDAGPQVLRYTHIVHAYLKKIPIDAIQRQVGLKRSRAIEIFSKLKLKTEKDAYEAFSD